MTSDEDRLVYEAEARELVNRAAWAFAQAAACSWWQPWRRWMLVRQAEVLEFSAEQYLALLELAARARAREMTRG